MSHALSPSSDRPTKRESAWVISDDGISNGEQGQIASTRMYLETPNAKWSVTPSPPRVAVHDMVRLLMSSRCGQGGHAGGAGHLPGQRMDARADCARSCLNHQVPHAGTEPPSLL